MTTPDGSADQRAGTAPVHDWACDFDHAVHEYNAHAPQIWRDLREGGCPVAHTERYGGSAWLPVTHDAIHQIAYDPEHFSSRNVVVTNHRLTMDGRYNGLGGAPPITSDPPVHAIARRLLLPAFAPKRIAPLEGEIRTLCRRLLRGLGDLEPGATFDAASEYAQHIPVGVIRTMLGFPAADEGRFAGFVHDVLERVAEPAEARRDGLDALFEYIERQVRDHIDDPRDDLTSELLAVEIEGRPLEPHHVVGTIGLLLIAGIDTTWSVIGSALLHLARAPADHRRLRDDPAVMPAAIEEFLRHHAPVTMARVVQQDHEFFGNDLKRGDWVLLPFPAANRDPHQFEDPDRFIIDRELNRHAAFGLGIHRCIGSNLARLELRVAVEEFVAHVPAIELAGPVAWSLGQVRGPRTVPVRITEPSVH
ncbi:MAG: cytochrome P450 [Actinomycetota bacterium]